MIISKEYLAGFIDGEGNLSLYKHKDNRVKNKFGVEIRLKISNTNKKCLEALQRQFGGKLSVSSRMKGCKDVYSLQWFDLKSIKKLLESVLEFLIIKQEQAKLLIRYCDLRLSKKRSNIPYTKQELKLIDRINSFNKRG